MPPKSHPDTANVPGRKTIKRCECGATVFQGPVIRGTFEGETFTTRETLYQCVNCHRVVTVQMLEDFEVPVLVN